MPNATPDPAGDVADNGALEGDVRALLEWLLSTNRVGAAYLACGASGPCFAEIICTIHMKLMSTAVDPQSSLNQIYSSAVLDRHRCMSSKLTAEVNPRSRCSKSEPERDLDFWDF